MSEKTYTGRARSRRTPPGIRRAERWARTLIGAGGVGTIAAVTLIFAFLLWVVVPLLAPASLEEEKPTSLAVEAAPLALGVDEYRLMAWTIEADGYARAVRLSDGAPVADVALFDPKELSACSFEPRGRDFVLGFSDGSMCIGRIGFAVSLRERSEAPPELRDLAAGETRLVENGVADLTPQKQIRTIRLQARLEERVKVASSAIRLVDFSDTPSAVAFAALAADGTLAIYTQTTRLNMMTGESETALDRRLLPYEPPAGLGKPVFLGLSGIGTILYLVWEDGFTLRYDARPSATPQVAETLDLVGGEARVTRIGFHIGKTTLLVGDTEGNVRASFPARPRDVGTADGMALVEAHVLEGPGSAVTAIAPSSRSRLLAVGYGSGEVRVYQLTAGALVASAPGEGAPVRAAAIAPKEDSVVALGARQVRSWAFDPGHPETTLGTLFGPVWYEGQAEPDHVWQSTGGSDDFEPKLGLWPVVFGTLKATLYSMLIAVPLALLAAVFTTEFLSPRMRTPVKSTIEMMASLPSVVLGFLAAIVIAPFVQAVVPATLACFVVTPLVILLGARLWQFVPQNLALRWSGLPRLAFICATVPVGVALAAALGPTVESLFFAGDIKFWLGAREVVDALPDALQRLLEQDKVGEFAAAAGMSPEGVARLQGMLDPTGGWTFLLLPLSLLVSAYLVARFVGPWLRQVSLKWDRLRCAIADMARHGLVLAGSVLIALVFSWLLAERGLDPRNAFLGVYAQRNAMIVGVVMGFAIVPIIYTLAEDALSSVPSQLREGSLGAGATPWQTAVRIIIPTAMSGLFSAMMVGLGRAVGETMIVLMAAGNTPIRDWSIFNGFRTLSANIAVELPEAVRDSTHYRTLFLAALLLFAMTFVINTLAEMVRRRFRARYQEQL